MTSMRDVVNGVRVLFTEIFPQAANSTGWSREQAERAFGWARHCEDLSSSPSTAERLDLALLEAGLETGRPSLFARQNVAHAPLLLLEEFLRNSGLGHEALTDILKGMAGVFGEDRFRSLTAEAKRRKALYQDAVKMVQTNDNSEAITLAKAMLLKEYLMKDMTLQVFQKKVEPLVVNVQHLKLLLLIVEKSADGHNVSDTLLASMIAEHLEALIESWLDGHSSSSFIKALLASPESLIRRACSLSEALLDSWLKALAFLGSQLKQVGSGRDRQWKWPENSDDSVGPSLRGVTFTYEQLTLHVQFLLSKSPVDKPSEHDDHTTKRVCEFLGHQQSLNLTSCLLWLDLERTLARSPSKAT